MDTEIKIHNIPIEDDFVEEDFELAKAMNDWFEEQHLEETKIPNMVFKYKSVASKRDIKRVCNMLKSKKIYMPTIKQLNDPLESANSFLLGSNEFVREKYFCNYRILSLSENPLNPIMWAYYSDNYQGICLGFKTDNRFSNVKKVNYYNGQYAIIFGENFSEEDLLKKGISWEHEEEWRILQKNIKNEYFEFDNDLCCVIFGSKVNNKIRRRIEKNIPEGVKLFTVKPDRIKFCLFAEGDSSNIKFYNVDELSLSIKT